MQKGVDTGNGVLAAERTEKRSTAEPSAQSPAGHIARRNTGNALGINERLQILQQAAFDLQANGVQVSVVNHPKQNAVILVLAGARYCSKCQYLRPIEEMLDTGICQECDTGNDTGNGGR